MPIQLIENFELSVPKPIDNRIVVGPGFTYTNKNSIPLPYVGMRIFDTNDSYPYLWTGSTWSFETNRVNVTHNITSNSDHFINFVSATGSPQLLQTNQTLRFNPLRGQITSGPGVARYPTYGFTSSNSSTFMGMWKVSSNTIGFSISRTSGTDFQISQTGITASQKFSVANNIPNAFTFGEGTARFGRLSGVFPSIEFYATSPNTALRVYNLSPVNIEGTRPGGLPGYSNATPETTGLSLENWTNNSVFNVRDQHYINTESRKGILSIGNAGNNDQFLFFMRDHTNTSSSGLFGLNGGGLYVQRNLSIGESVRISATASILGNLIVGGSSQYTIDAGANFFAGVTPKAEIITGFSSGDYSELVVLRHPVVNATVANRRIGMIMKLSAESTNPASPESYKMGGMMLESVDGSANYPGLFFLTQDKKRIQIDHSGNIGLGNVSESSTWNRNNILSNSSLFISQSNGQCLFTNGSYAAPAISFINSTNTGFNFDQTNNRIGMNLGGVIRLRIGANDIFADIHNKGTGGIGDSGNDGNPWNFPTLASGTYVPVVNSNTNCNTFNTYNAAWMRVGNVVSVSGRIRLTVDAINIATEFRLSLPINSNFGVDSNTPGSNDWQLNGVGKLVSIVANIGSGTFAYDSGNVASIEARASSGGGNDALFRFKSSYTGTCYLTYNFQYIIGSWSDTIVTVPID